VFEDIGVSTGYYFSFGFVHLVAFESGSVVWSSTHCPRASGRDP